MTVASSPIAAPPEVGRAPIGCRPCPTGRRSRSASRLLRAFATLHLRPTSSRSRRHVPCRSGWRHGAADFPTRDERRNHEHETTFDQHVRRARGPVAGGRLLDGSDDPGRQGHGGRRRHRMRWLARSSAARSVPWSARASVPTRATWRRAARSTARRSRTDRARATTRRRCARVQQALNDRGFNAGPVDGQWGPATSDALRRFQLAAGLPATGSADSQTMVGARRALSTRHCVPTRPSSEGLFLCAMLAAMNDVATVVPAPDRFVLGRAAGVSRTCSTTCAARSTSVRCASTSATASW